jgi:hypothetical protein
MPSNALSPGTAVSSSRRLALTPRHRTACLPQGQQEPRDIGANVRLAGGPRQQSLDYETGKRALQKQLTFKAVLLMLLLDALLLDQTLPR